MTLPAVPYCDQCGRHMAPALEHHDGCPYKVEFFGGRRSWPRDREHRREDGQWFRWGSPGTWVPFFHDDTPEDDQ